jgi:hypothetical protein
MMEDMRVAWLLLYERSHVSKVIFCTGRIDENKTPEDAPLTN